MSVERVKDYSEMVCFIRKDLYKFSPPASLKKRLHFLDLGLTGRDDAVVKRKLLKRSRTVDDHEMCLAVNTELLRLEEEMRRLRKRRLTVPESNVVELMNMSSHLIEEIADGKCQFSRYVHLT